MLNIKDLNSLECEICISGYKIVSGKCTLNSTSSQSVNDTISSQNCNNSTEKYNYKIEAQNLRTTSIVIVGTTSGICTLLSILNTSSLATLWLVFNQLQLLYLLFLSRSYLPEEVQLVIKGFKFSLNVYEYIPIRKIEIFRSLFEHFNFELTNSLLEPFGINSDSTIFNLYPIVLSLILIICIQLCIYIIGLFLKCCCENANCIINFFQRILAKILNFMTLGFYIRNILEIFQFILISATYELYKANVSSIERIFSFLIAIFMIIVLLILSIFTFYLSLSSYKINERKHNKLGEFFSGLKQQKKFKIYNPILLLRRGFFVIFLITLVSINSKIMICITSFVQLIYTIYLCFLRPLDEVKCNIIEIVNEVFFLLLFSSLAFLNEEPNWSGTVTLIYICVIVSNNILIAIIVCSFAIFQGVKWIIRRLYQIANNNGEGSEVAPKKENRSENTILNRENHLSIVEEIESESNQSKLKEECKSSSFQYHSNFNSEICINKVEWDQDKPFDKTTFNTLDLLY